MKLLVINGPNMNMLGIREPELYGRQDYAALCAMIESVCAREGIEVECFQSNHEGAIVDRIQQTYGSIDGIVINAAAYTHTSIAIADALAAVSIPAVEVHLTDVNSRESYRRVSYIEPCCITRFIGLGFEGYCRAVLYLKDYLTKNGSVSE